MGFRPHVETIDDSVLADQADLVVLGVKLGISKGEFSGWYDVDAKALAGVGGEPLLLKYGNTMYSLLSKLFPEHPWLAFKFGHAPRGYWASTENQRAFLEDLAPKLQIDKEHLDGWYRIDPATVIKYGGKGVLKRYNDSLIRLLAAVYPNHPWDPSKFTSRPRNYWASFDNQLKFMDELGKKIGVNSEVDLWKWYSQPIRIFDNNGASGLFALYEANLPKLLASIYPNYNWELWRFPRRIGQVLENDEEFDKMFDGLEKALDIKTPEDWYRVTAEQLSQLAVPSLYKRRGGVNIAKFLSRRYPNVEWDDEVFFGRGFRQATQRWLSEILAGLFPSETMFLNYRYASLKKNGDRKEFQLDAYFPHLSLAFEYQGIQHYEQLNVCGDLKGRLSSDEEKAACCARDGISLIHVPFWWNKQRPPLLAAILEQRPDLFTTKLLPFLDEARQGAADNDVSSHKRNPKTPSK